MIILKQENEKAIANIINNCEEKIKIFSENLKEKFERRIIDLEEK